MEKKTHVEYPQTHFEFKDYEAALKCWLINKEIYGNDIQFVVSTHPYTSGYWIEAVGTELGELSTIYSDAQVKDLMRRAEIEKKKADKQD